MKKTIVIFVLVLLNVVLGLNLWLQQRTLHAQALADAADRSAHAAFLERASREKKALVEKKERLTTEIARLPVARPALVQPASVSRESRPEAIKAHLETSRLVMERPNPLLFSRLNLTATEKNAFLDLLAARYARRNAIEATLDDQQQADIEFTRQARALLGEEKAAIAEEMIVKKSDLWNELTTIDRALRYEGRILDDREVQIFADRLANAHVSAAPANREDLDNIIEKRRAITTQLLTEAKSFLAPSQLLRLEQELRDNTALERTKLYRRMKLERPSVDAPGKS